MSEFCKGCGQKVAAGVGSMFSKVKPIEFEDGFYCEECAKIRVARSRQ